jgi:hypothetical protein
MKVIFIPNKALIAISLILWILVSSWGRVNSLHSAGLMCMVLISIGIVISVKNQLRNGLPHILAGGLIAVFTILIGRGPAREFNEHLEQIASSAERSKKYLAQLQSNIPRVDHPQQSAEPNEEIRERSITKTPPGESRTLTELNKGKPTNDNRAHKGVKIKGFHIGMNIENVPDLVESIEPRWTAVIQVAEDASWYSFPPDFDKGTRIHVEAGTKFVKVQSSEKGTNLGQMEVAIFVADEKGEVSQFVWNEDLVKSFFRADKTELSDFVQKFINSYGISQMNISDDFRYWYHTDPEGWMIKIGSDWSIHLEGIMSAEESDQAFD